MNITELRYLVAIKKWGSVSAAAKQLYAAQPNVSKALKNLEEEYGLRIFERSSTGMIPTEQGRRFIEQAARVLEEVDRLTEDAHHARERCAELRVMIPHATYASYAAVDFLKEAAGADQLRIHIREGGSMEALDFVLRRGYHLALLRYAAEDDDHYIHYCARRGLKMEPVMEFEYRLLTNRDGPLAKREVKDLSELNHYMEIMHDDFQLPGEDGGDGIRSGGGVTISGNTVNAAGGNGGKVGGYGICSFDRVAISGGTVEAAGGNGSTGGGSGIYSSVIDLSGSLELTAKAGSPNGKALSRAGSELELDTIKDKLGPGAKVTATDANGETKQVSIPRPVEPEKPVIPEESSSSSDGGSAAPSAPAFSLPGLTVTDKDGQRISYTSTQSGNALTVCVGRLTASFRISLATLRQLRAEGIETIAFQTVLCSTTLSLDELLAMGGEDAEVVLTHHIRSSTLTVGGKDV